jgi:hypothetical protein
MEEGGGVVEMERFSWWLKNIHEGKSVIEMPGGV